MPFHALSAFGVLSIGPPGLAALPWYQLMLDTLAGPTAPWRRQQHPTASAAAGSP
jgi:hypothetical protein